MAKISFEDAVRRQEEEEERRKAQHNIFDPNKGALHDDEDESHLGTLKGIGESIWDLFK